MGSEKKRSERTRHLGEESHSSQQWIMKGFDDLRDRLDRMEDRLSQDIRNVSSRVDDIDEKRLRPLEKRFWMAVGAVAVLSALTAFLGTSLGNRYDFYFVPRPSSPPVEVSAPSGQVSEATPSDG